MQQNYLEILLSEIRTSPFNPRKRFDGPKMDELIESGADLAGVVPAEILGE